MDVPPATASPASPSVSEPSTGNDPVPDVARPAPVGTAHGPGVFVIRWTGLTLALLLVVLGSLQVVSLFFRQSQQVSTPLSSTVHEVVLGTSLGDIQVRTAEPGETAHLDRHETWSLSHPEVSVSETDGVLTVDAVCASRDTSHPIGIGVSACDVDLDLVVDEATTVVAHSDTGDLTVRNVSGRVQASTSTGSITLTEVTAAEVSVSTSTGDITLDLARAPTEVKARTSTGDVRIDVPRDGTAYRVLSSASIGEPTIEVPTDTESPNLIDVSTSIGDIVITTGPS
jgi:hypothetical protein